MGTRLKGWRTIGINVLTLLAVLLAWEPLATWVDPQYLLEGQALVNIALRLLTDGPAKVMDVLTIRTARS